MLKNLCGSFGEAMKRWSRAQILRATEVGYAALALFALTQGPVYQVWKLSAERVNALPNPSMPFVYFASFMAIQAPAAALFARRIQVEWFREHRNVALLAFLGWMGLSVWWSTFSRHSLPEFVALVATSIFGAYLATSFTTRQFWWIVVSAMTLGVAISWFAVMRLWDGAFNFREEYWIGIYYNRNSLAPVAAVAVISALSVLIWESKSLRENILRGVSLVVAPAIAVAMVASIEIWKSKSQTSPAALVAAIVIVTVWLVLRWATSRVAFLSRFAGYAATATLILSALSLFFFLRFLPGASTVSADITTLSSRREFWSQSWLAILEKPWWGWGWMAAWRTPEFYRLGNPPPEWVNSWSHNGYHDIVLGGGLVAAMVFCVYLLLSWSSIGRSTTRSGALDMLLSGFVLVAATQESFFVGSHFLWALLVATLSRPIPSNGAGSTA